MNKLLKHPLTNNQLIGIMANKPHAVMITGAKGAGKKALARYAIKNILQVKSLNNYPYFLHILPNNNSIGIDTIRHIKEFLNKRTIGKQIIRRVVLISDAHAMTIEAQNSLLKILEEPPEDTMIILTVSDPSLLKPTIMSRAQLISVFPISKSMAIKELRTLNYAEPAITSAYHISRGQAGLLTALLKQESDHELANAIKQAKEFLQMDIYERLVKVDALSKQKDYLPLFIEALERVIASGLEQAALKNKQIQVKNFHFLSKSVQKAQEALSKNANAKLVLSNLLLEV